MAVGVVVACLTTSSIIVAAAISPLTTVRVASGLTRPTFAAPVPGDSGRLFVTEQGGLIKVLDLGTGTVLGTPFLDLTSVVSCCGDRGLYAIAFHPSYATNGYFFVSYTNTAGDSELARYQVLGDPATSDIANPASASILLTIAEPHQSHNIGWIAFGPSDGYLYIGKGDGGFSTCDPGQRAQDLDELHGKLLRIDVDGAAPYGIPPGNPFVGVAGADEIWAYGLRNPWRNSFDAATGDLFIADVGQLEREEIDFQPAGGGGENYGWDCMEGSECSTISGCGTAGCTCGAPGLLLPIHEYDHTVGCSITGGEVYRGAAITDLGGTYFFADFCTNKIWSFRYDGATMTDFQERTSELAPGGGLSITSIVSFGTDADGEVYLLDLFGGEIFQIIGTPACGDGVVDAGEQCDDGSDNGTASSCCLATCVHKANGSGSCDGNPCTRPDTCTNGTCTPGSCADGSACTYCGGTCSDGGSSCDCF